MAAKFLAKIEQHDAALTFSRDLLMRMHRGGEFEPAQSRAFVRNFMRLGLITAKSRMCLVEMALAGEEEADTILRDAILEYQSWHREMPDELIEYNRKLVAGMVSPPGWSGPRKKNQFMRDICIASVVAAVVDQFGLKPTGHSVRRRSACAIVAQALAEIGMAIGYEAVATIWKMYGRRLHLPRGWVAAMGPLPR